MDILMIATKRNFQRFGLWFLVIFAIILRVICLPVSNDDLNTYNLPWYEFISRNGILNSLSTGFANYSPPYTYLLAAATLTRAFLPPLIAIKLIPILFDLLGAFFFYKITRLMHPRGILPILAAAVYFTAPTVILNSSYWGQADSIYTSFLLICLFFLMTDKPLYAILAFGAAFAFKAQAVFFLPLLLIITFRNRLPIGYFFLVPVIYLVLSLPVVLLGRPFLDVLLIYARQAGSYPVLAANAPNLYYLFPREWYSIVLPIGLGVGAIALAAWIYATQKNRIQQQPRELILIAYLSVALTPFLLPKMHDRYFYPADVLSILLAFFWPELWVIPLLSQLASLTAYAVFLFGTPQTWVVLAAFINTFAIILALRTQQRLSNRTVLNPRIPRAVSWLVTLLTPILLLGLSMRILLTPYFVRFEYNLPYFPADEYGFTKQDRLYWSSFALDYLLNTEDIRYLGRLNFEDGTQVFNDRERAHMEDVKAVVGHALTIWQGTLLGILVIGLFAWIGGWLNDFRQGMARGGRLMIALAVTVGLIVIVGLTISSDVFWQFFTFFHKLFFEGDSWLFYYSDTLIRLFPLRFWQDAFLWAAAIALGGGFALTLSLRRNNATSLSVYNQE
jgi:integral membrane protein (TIGR01906 family)